MDAQVQEQADAPLVTLVIVPRERFSVTERCLGTIIANTTTPYRLVYVVGDTPGYVRDYLTETCAKHGFTLIQRPGFLISNAARNLGLAAAATRYVVYLENDVVVAPGWLEPLVACAEETGADLVSPLCLIGEPADGLVHSAGGTLNFIEGEGGWELDERHRVVNLCLNTQTIRLARESSDFADSHCMLFRRTALERIGPADEEVSAAAHTDLSLAVKETGGLGYLEPASLVSYLSFDEYTVGDLPYFAVRWSDEWFERSAARLSAKWRLPRSARFFANFQAFTRRHQVRACMPRPNRRGPAPIDPAAHGFAQTNVQLLNQLHAAGYRADEIAAVAAAYDAAVQLFAASFRPSGKPFLAHLVGTASILAAYGAHVPLVIAGLLHASHASGQFPKDVKADLDGQRRWLRRRVGSVAGAIIREYDRLDRDWIAATIDRRGIERLPLNVAYAVVIRLANAIEERLDHGAAYWETPDVTRRRAEERGDWASLHDAIAAQLGYGDMLAALRTLANAAAAPDVPAFRAHGVENYVIDPQTGTSTPIARTAPRDEPREDPPEGGGFGMPAGLLPLGELIAPLDLGALGPLNAGTVTHGQDGVTLECDARQWAYSSGLDLSGVGRQGPAVLKMTLEVLDGELGIGVLVKGSSTEFVAREFSATASAAHEPTILLMPLPALEEAGHLVLRSWSAGAPTRARLLAAELYRRSDRIPEWRFSVGS